MIEALIEENGAPFSKSITQHKAFLNQPLGEGWANHTLHYLSITLNKKCALIMNSSDALKRASSSGAGSILWLLKNCYEKKG
ncbi:MAG: hypothetical protein HRT51_18370 [Colwellia sp.]|nr:hypothetical protein [Colwellia sp.]